ASTLETADHLISKAAFATEGKKTLLVPAIYCIPALLGIPILAFAAVVQHFLGLLLVVLCGLLVRAWFRHWRALIVPVTCVIALHPVLLWYEHVALAETYAVFAVVLLALVGWTLYRRPGRWTLAAFLVTLFFTATARPEGNLFGIFGLALVGSAFWGQWRPLAFALGVTFAWTVFLFAITQTSQSGTLLYASVVHLTPARLWFSPGVAEAVQPVVASSQVEWNSRDVPGLVSVRKDLQDAISRKLVGDGLTTKEARGQIDSVCKLAGIETVLRHPLLIPNFALRKFVIGHHEPPALGFNDYVVAGQTEALFEDGERQKGLRTSDLAWGRTFPNAAAARKYFEETTTPLPRDWLWRYLKGFTAASLAPLLPIPLPGSSVAGVAIRGLPWLYAGAVLGMLSLAIRTSPLMNFHLLFGLFLVGFFVIVMVTANVRARFRFVFEPFWILYATALVDSTWCVFDRCLQRGKRNPAAASA
ncbi:MAG: hypothetical protein WA771_07285, partial [Chthoniobacterales bacterium]